MNSVINGQLDSGFCSSQVKSDLVLISLSNSNYQHSKISQFFLELLSLW